MAYSCSQLFTWVNKEAMNIFNLRMFQEIERAMHVDFMANFEIGSHNYPSFPE